MIKQVCSVIDKRFPRTTIDDIKIATRYMSTTQPSYVVPIEKEENFMV